MKAAIYRGIREFEVADVPIAEPGDGQLLLKLDYCSICGSDLHGYTQGLWTAPGLIMGHEYAGTVAKLGPNFVGDVEVGDKITICGLTPCGVCDMCRRGVPHLCPNMRGAQGAYAEYTTPASPGVLPMFHKLPENVSTMEGAMVEPLSVGLHAAKMPKYQLNDTIVVIGLGTIGLCTMQCARALCASATIIAVDLSQQRLDLALELGADYAINPLEVEDVYAAIEEITGPQPQAYGHPGLVDVVFECCGIRTTYLQAMALTKGGGTIVCVAVSESTEQPFDPNQLVQKEITMHGSYAYIHEFDEAIELLAKGVVKVKPLITDIYPIEEIDAAFQKQLDTKNSIKVIIDCRPERLEK